MSSSIPMVGAKLGVAKHWSAAISVLCAATRMDRLFFSESHLLTTTKLSSQSYSMPRALRSPS